MFRVVRAQSWQAARKLVSILTRWAYRGQPDLTWGLTTTIERAAKRFSCHNHVFLFNREAFILRQFQRRAHHYISSPPDAEQRLEWLALIQHHGGPTRLLDFSYSFYVAAFFAIETASHDAAVWAIRLSAIEDAIGKRNSVNMRNQTTTRINGRHIQLAEEQLARVEGAQLVINVEPERLSKRMSIQQGLFLIPCDLSRSFDDNLIATFEETNDAWDHSEISADNPSLKDEIDSGQLRTLKIIIPRNCHRTAMKDLKAMNVTASSLFPGLDGFARSLYHEMREFDYDEKY